MSSDEERRKQFERVVELGTKQEGLLEDDLILAIKQRNQARESLNALDHDYGELLKERNGLEEALNEVIDTNEKLGGAFKRAHERELTLENQRNELRGRLEFEGTLSNRRYNDWLTGVAKLTSIRNIVSLARMAGSIPNLVLAQFQQVLGDEFQQPTATMPDLSGYKAACLHLFKHHGKCLTCDEEPADTVSLEQFDAELMRITKAADILDETKWLLTNPLSKWPNTPDGQNFTKVMKALEILRK